MLNHFFVTFTLIFYGFSWLTRIQGCIRRARQPLLRGPEWFFDVHVPPGFYTGVGKRLRHQYMLRMLIPVAFEILIAATILIFDHLIYLYWLVAGMITLIHINHVYSVDLAERQARPYALPEAEQPMVFMASTLKPRRLRDYSSRAVEWTLALATAAGLALLVRFYFAAPQHHNLKLVFWVPAFYLYLQLGILFVKQIIVRWRSPVPRQDVAEHIEAREQTRVYYLKMCDFSRAFLTAPILFWPILLNAPLDRKLVYVKVYTIACLVLSVVVTVLIEIKRKQLTRLVARARPARLPDLLHQSELARWPVCYQPSAPLLVLKGARGYSLNLANQLTHLGAAYLAGEAVLIALMRWH